MMQVMQGYAAYQKVRVNTASQSRLLLMMYDGAITNLNLAVQAMEGKQHEESHKRLVKTQEIIAELMGALNMDVDISHNLYALYEYCHERLVAANIEKMAEPVHEVLGYLTELRDTWQQAMQEGEGTPAQNEAPVARGIEVSG